MDAAQNCVNEAYKKVLEENKDLEIVAQPSFEIKSINEKGIEFIFTLTLKPEVKLGKYKDLKVKKDKVEVTKEEIDRSIDELRHRFAENVNKEGPIENGDIAIIDFEGFKDGIAFEGGKAENYSLTIGSNTFIPGFEEGLIGLKKGDEKDLNLKFPEDYHSEELKGKEVVFKAKVKEVKKTVIPEINEDFFADLGMEGIVSKEALENQIKENLLARKEIEAENKYIDDLLEVAAKEVEIDIPDVMLDEELDRMIKQYEEHLKMQGLTLEQFYQFTNSDEKALKEQMKDEATKRITYRLMLEEIVKQENIKIEDKEAEEEASKLAEKYKMKKEEILNVFSGLEMIKYDLQMRKAIDILKG
jgi:trigger factor